MLVVDLQLPRLIDSNNPEQIIEFTPNDIAMLDDDVLDLLLIDLKRITKITKAAEEEVKNRIRDGKAIKHFKFNKPTTTKTLRLDQKNIATLIEKYGFDAIEVKSLPKLKKLFGEKIEDELSDHIVLGLREGALRGVD